MKIGDTVRFDISVAGEDDEPELIKDQRGTIVKPSLIPGKWQVLWIAKNQLLSLSEHTLRVENENADVK